MVSGFAVWAEQNGKTVNLGEFATHAEAMPVRDAANLSHQYDLGSVRIAHITQPMPRTLAAWQANRARTGRS